MTYRSITFKPPIPDAEKLRDLAKAESRTVSGQIKFIIEQFHRQRAERATSE